MRTKKKKTYIATSALRRKQASRIWTSVSQRGAGAGRGRGGNNLKISEALRRGMIKKKNWETLHALFASKRKKGKDCTKSSTIKIETSG